jgi:hypothetical protein
MKLKQILNLNNLFEFFELKVKEGDVLFLGDRKLKVIDIRPLPFGPPRVINIETGNEFTLSRNDIPKLTKTPPKISGYEVEKKFRDWVVGILKGIEYPAQSISFVNFIDSGKKSGVIQLSFTEEVKDGRLLKFNEKEVLKLKGKQFNTDSMNILISNIKFTNTDVESIRGSEYHRFYYTLNLKIK